MSIAGQQRCPMVVVSGNSHPELAQTVAEKLSTHLCDCCCYHKANRETVVEIKESIRGKDVYIIQTGTKDVNNDMMELQIIAYACKTSSARKVVGVVPYIPYSKQSKMRKRGSIVCKLLAKMLSTSGLTHIITIDLHQKEIQGFFDIPVDNLRASPFLIEYIQGTIPDFRNAVIVARNPNSVKRVTSFAERLRLSIAVIHGEDKDEDEPCDGRTSPPPLMQEADFGIHPIPDSDQGKQLLPLPAAENSNSTSILAKEKPPLNVVGDVGGRIAIIVDDMIDDVMSFVKIAEVLKERGAYKIYAMATHGLLSSDAPRLIEDSCIDEVVVTNTVPHEIQKMQCHKIKTVDISGMLVEAIRRIHNNESMSYLFRYIGMDD
ncbi:phosphoribosyl pyrophosphate synthase-associated protein 2-like isoform X1 [Mercenaria mercenaria]|uniref:phosphoribosyl pyrophosphate synthase-associated protein 2-like isoform X1 n=1 Tax=Mercenaria mercenaria TaxID=6596 RepID=UPI00234F7B0C|nr:phosphoribosyl pyrophosphate synthase-associated protein 2-like isoform X1 [Mercenaria mercenaria]